MPEWPDDDLDLDAPLALPAELRSRLADALSSDLAATLEGLDGPRPLSPRLRSRLEAQLLARHRRRPVVIGGAVAAGLAVLAAAGLALGTQGPRSSPGAQAAPRHPSASASSLPTAAPAGGPGEGSGTSASSGATSQALSPASAFPDAAAGPAGAAPAVARVTPAGGPATGGEWVLVDGTALTGARAVTFGGAPAAFVVVSDEELRAQVPPHAPGTVDVEVSTATATSAVSAGDRFRYS